MSNIEDPFEHLGVLHMLRNPAQFTQDELRANRLLAADTIERLTKEINVWRQMFQLAEAIPSMTDAELARLRANALEAIRLRNARQG